MAVSEPPSSGIAGRIVRAAGAQGLNQFARVVQLFLLVPICLTAWGTPVYEDWILLGSITAFLVLADLGFIQFTTVKLIDAWSGGDRDRFAREWALALGFFAALTAVVGCLTGLSLLVPFWGSFVPVHHMDEMEIAWAAVLMCWAQILWMLICVTLGIYRARGDLSRSYHVCSILVALQTAGIALPAWLGAGPVMAAAGNCLVNGLWLAVIIADLCWLYPDVKWRLAWPSSDEWLHRLRHSVGYLASPVSLTIMLNGPNLILAQIGAPQGAIALFSTSRSVAGVARQLPYQFAHPAGVELASLLARGDRAGVARVYASASRALAIVVGLLSGITLAAAPLVMTLWTRGKVGYDPLLMLLLVGTTAVCAPAQVAFTLLWYGGYPGRLSKGLIFSTALAMALALLLGPWFEARGVAAGIGIGEIIGIGIYLSLLADRVLERPVGTGLLRNFLITVAAFSTSAGWGYLLDRLLEPRGWLGLIELGIAWCIPAAAALYFLLLSRTQQARLRSVAINILRAPRSRAALKAAKSADLG